MASVTKALTWIQQLTLSRPAKGALVILLTIIILYQVHSQYSSLGTSLQTLVDQLSLRGILVLTSVVLLMPVNWLMESTKWRHLIPQPPSRWAAYRAVLLGNSVGLATPANIGDYAGRLSALDKSQYQYGLAATLVSSIAQNAVNICVGIVGALYLLVQLDYVPLITIVKVLVASLVGVTIIVTTVYVRIDKLRQHFRQLKARYSVLSKLSEARRQYTVSDLSHALRWSSMRYIIYTLQYVLILYVVGIHLPLQIALAGIATIYLVQSGLPLPPMLGLLARGETAIIVWGSATGGNIVPILAASFGLWFINRAFASVCGLAFWYSSK